MMLLPDDSALAALAQSKGLPFLHDHQPSQSQKSTGPRPARPAHIEGHTAIWKFGEVAAGIQYDIYGCPQLLLTKHKSLLSFVEGRKFGGEGSTGDNGGRHDILVRRSDDNGNTWHKPVLVHTESRSKQVVVGNPAAVLDELTGRIFVLMCLNNTEVLLTYSDTNGQTWSKARNVTKMVKEEGWGWYATTFSGIQLRRQPKGGKNGRLVICADHQNGTFINDGKQIYSHSHVIFSDDGGETWHIGGSVTTPTSNECSLAELAHGALIMNSRNYIRDSNHVAHRGFSWSHDGGESWSESLYLPPTLVDPIVFGSMTTDSAGTMLIITHPSNPNSRVNMTVFTSVDRGASWEAAVTLDQLSAQTAYSSIVALPNGSYAVEYEVGLTHAAGCVFTDCHHELAVITFFPPVVSDRKSVV